MRILNRSNGLVPGLSALLAALLCGPLGACAPGIELIPAAADPIRAGQNAIQFNSSGQPGGRIAVELSGFRLQSLLSPPPRSLKLYLVPGNSGTQTPSLGPFVLDTTRLNEQGDSQFVAFHNVPAGSYYVAASAYSQAGGEGNNLTDSGHDGQIDVLDGEAEHAYVTTSGGEENSFPGRVTVMSDYSIHGTAQLQLRLYVRVLLRLGSLGGNGHA
ncbi:MAG: hypothetical protein ACAI44_16930 [Candidatus Sericytochromatia bacterium]